MTPLTHSNDLKSKIKKIKKKELHEGSSYSDFTLSRTPLRIQGKRILTTLRLNRL